LVNQARGFLVVQGECAFDTLGTHWDELSEKCRTWLMTWGASKFPANTAALVIKANRSDSEAPMVAGLEAIAKYGKNKGLFARAISNLAWAQERRHVSEIWKIDIGICVR
jgi:hypothetical protein